MLPNTMAEKWAYRYDILNVRINKDTNELDAAATNVLTKARPAVCISFDEAEFTNARPINRNNPPKEAISGRPHSKSYGLVMTL